MDSYHLKGSHFQIFGSAGFVMLSILFASHTEPYDLLIVGGLFAAAYALLGELLPKSWHPWFCAAASVLTALFPWFYPVIALSVLRLSASKYLKFAVFAFFCVIALTTASSLFVFGVLGSLLACILFLAVNHYVVTRYDYEVESEAKREYSRLVHMLRESGRREVERSARESMLAERNRIARSLHDYIGHTISASIMQLEAFKALYHPEEVGEDNTHAHIDRVISTLKSGMVDIRSSIHHLYDESLNLKDRLEELVGGYPQMQSWIQVSDDEDIPYAVKKELLQMVAGLVANVARHSDATTVRIVLSKVGKYHTLQVRDNGTKKPAGGEGRLRKGLGITSLEDFAASHNGSVAYGYQNGFYVHMRFEGMGGMS